jgi:hypothetical protein
MLASNPLACVQQQRLCNAYQKRWHGQHARLSGGAIRKSGQAKNARGGCGGGGMHVLVHVVACSTALAVIEFIGPLESEASHVRPSARLKRRTRGCCCWDACCCRCSSLGCWFCASRRTRRRVLLVVVPPLARRRAPGTAAVKWRSQDFELRYFHNRKKF